MGQKIQILNQAVDTLKLHIYPDTTDQNLIDRYNQFVDELKDLKLSAQDIHHSNNDLRYLKTEIADQSFNVMATTTKGFSVSIKNNDVSLSFKKITDLSLNPIIKVEFATMFLYRFGAIKTRDFILDFIEKNFIPEYKGCIAELHICSDIQGYEFSQLDFYRLQKPTRKNGSFELHDNNQSSDLFSSYFYSSDFTGFTFGSDHNHLRIYDKTKEIKLKKNKDYIKYIWGDKYDETQNVWRIEHQFRRKLLKTMYVPNVGLRCDDFNILDHLEYLWSYTMKNFKLKDISDDHAIEHLLGYKKSKNGKKQVLTKEGVRTRLKRADLMPVWEVIQTFNGFKGLPIKKVKEVATASFQYVKNSLSALFSTMLKHFGGIDGNYITEAFKLADDHKRLDKGHTLIDDVYLKSIDYLHSVDKLKSDYGLISPINNDIRVAIKNHLMESLNMLSYNPVNTNTIEKYMKKIEKLGA